MKIRARTVTGTKVAIDCAPFFGAGYTVYAMWIDDAWFLPSGRRVPDRMLDAIDRLVNVDLSSGRKGAG